MSAALGKATKIEKEKSIQALGSGHLIIKPTKNPRLSTAMDISCTVTEFEIQWKADKGDSEFVLCGDEIPGARTYSYAIKAKLFVSLAKEAFLQFTWKNKGQEAAFEFRPNKTGAEVIKGTVVIDPIDYGGKINQNVSVEFTWDGVGDAEIADKSDYEAAE